MNSPIPLALEGGPVALMAVGCGGRRGQGEEPSRRPALQGAIAAGVTGCSKAIR